jgi:predicted protein tyrosine phosphatase
MLLLVRTGSFGLLTVIGRIPIAAIPGDSIVSLISQIIRIDAHPRVRSSAMNLLFVCSRNRRRSLTAEAVFSDLQGHSVLSAGTSPDANTPVSADLIEWADIIFAMEAVHRRRLNQRFSALLRTKRIVVLGIPDEYGYMDQSLIDILRTKISQHLKV